jgi:hypothetical protein
VLNVINNCWKFVRVKTGHCRLVRFFLNGSAALAGPGRYIGFLIYTRAVGLLERVISSSQGLYLNTHTEKQIYTPLNIHAQGGIRARNHGLPAIEDCSYLRPLGYRDRFSSVYKVNKIGDPWFPGLTLKK